MTSEYDETCLVCCQKTKKRCASCAKAGIDLYFCSPEHQKLVWTAHKEVCGPGKANPFTWPLLSQHEADEAIKHMHDCTGLLARFPDSGSTVAKAVHHFLRVPPAQLTDLVQGLTSTRTAVKLGHDRQQLLLLVVRAHEYARKTTVPTLANPLPIARNVNLLGQLSHHDLYSSREDISHAREDEPWRSRYQHFIGRNHQLIKTEIAATHPRLAQKMLETIVQANQHMQAAGIPSFHT